MLLRRVVAHLRKQEWTAIAIDFVIVVLGVFVGIQLGNWNDARLERAQSAVFTRALVADLHADAVLYRGVADYYASVSDNAERVLESLEGGAPLSDEDLLISAYRASQVALVPVNRSTFDELVSTGRINLITDAALRQTAIEHFGFNYIEAAAADGRQSDYRSLFRATMPPDAHRAAREHCGDVESTDIIALDYHCVLGLSDEAILQAAEALRAEPTMPAALRSRINGIDVQTRDLIARATRLERALSPDALPGSSRASGLNRLRRSAKLALRPKLARSRH